MRRTITFNNKYQEKMYQCCVKNGMYNSIDIIKDAALILNVKDYSYLEKDFFERYEKEKQLSKESA